MRKKMTIELIWAQGARGELGLKDQLPWRLPADMKHFRDITIGNTVIMGRKTYLSLPGPLKDRKHVVLTRDPEPVWVSPDDWVYDNHIQLLNDLGKSKAIVIGGREIYDLFMPFATTLHVTHINEDFEADTYAPSIPDNFKIASCVEGIMDEKNKHPHTFITYKLGELK
jgi:dihydrofolate reductase